ncbi:MAG: hypothetical protein C4315_02960 [Chloroflexota bacterium]
MADKRYKASGPGKGHLTGGTSGGRLGAATLWVGVENLLERAGGVAANVAGWSGALAVTCFVLILLSGVYLFFSYQVGAEAGYRSVQALSAEPLGGLMRAVHRYASRGFMVFAALHLVRYLATGRFRGPWWLAWVTGFVMLFIAWFVGLTGYLLVWDVAGFAAARVLAEGIDRLGILGQPLRLSLVEAGALRDNIFLILLYLHITMPLLGAFFGWLHLARVARPRLLPPPFVAVLTSAFYVAVGILRPVPNLEPADPTRLPGSFPADPFYLAYMFLPELAGWAVLGVGVGLTVLPLVGRQPPTARVDPARCTGCGFCVADCPYGAVRLQPGKGRPVAVVDPARCVGCAICVGACPLDGIELNPPLKLPAVPSKPGLVVLTCKAAPGKIPSGAAVIRLPCVAALPVSRVRELSRQGTELLVVPCGLSACVYREGSTWVLGRAGRRRFPYWPRRVLVALGGTLKLPLARSNAGWGRVVAAVVLVGSLLPGVWDGPQWEPTAEAAIQIVVRTEAPFLWSRSLTEEEKSRLLPHMRADVPVAGERADLQLAVTVDGARYEWVIRPGGIRRNGPSNFFTEVYLNPGHHHLSFRLTPVAAGASPLATWEGTIEVERGMVRLVAYGLDGGGLTIR